MSPVNPLTRYPVIPLKVRDYFLCILSALLLILSFPKFDIEIFSWIGFVPLFFAIRNKSKARAFLLSYLTGIIFWLGIAYWLIHVTLVGMILLVLYLALYFGVFGFLVSTYLLPTTHYLLFIPSLWVILEYIRLYLFTGFPWALLGYAQYLNLPVIQIADITGAWGLSFLTMSINLVVYLSLNKKLGVKLTVRPLLLPVFLLFLSLTYGYYTLNLSTTYYPLPTKLKVSVIQGNIPQHLKWDIRAEDFIWNKYLNLTASAAQDKPDLIIWPEASLPVALEVNSLYYDKLNALVKDNGLPLLLGAVTLSDDLYYNSALLIFKQKASVNKYDKLHLVPFGEYIPLRKVFRFLETVVPIGDFTTCKEYTVFNLLNVKFSVLICFEDLFPDLSREFTKRGANFLINITNDAWFGETSSPVQHLQASVFRAVENRLFLLRAANTGVSGFIDAYGRIVSLVKDKAGRNIFVDGYSTEEISLKNKNSSFYTRYGDIFIIFCFLIILYGITRHFRKLKMKKILLFSLIILTFYITISLYLLDKEYFLCPIFYKWNMLIRSDYRGEGFFAAERNGRRIHQGLDLEAEIGTQVFASRAGRVVRARQNNGMGKFIIIRHQGNFTSLYGHLIEINVVENQFVRQRQLIGTVGRTGNARYSGIIPHLHFEVRKDGVSQDPLEYLQ